jgi:hypothetical protein
VATSDCHDDTADSTEVSGGQNLIGNNAGCSTAFNAATADFVNAAASPVSLGSLANNGGPTKTISIGKHSKAKNHAGSDAPTRDQRGVKRSDPDIGAFERI